MLSRTLGVLILSTLLSSCATTDPGGNSRAGFKSADRSQDRNVTNSNTFGGTSRDFGTGE